MYIYVIFVSPFLRETRWIFHSRILIILFIVDELNIMLFSVRYTLVSIHFSFLPNTTARFIIPYYFLFLFYVYTVKR